LQISVEPKIPPDHLLHLFSKALLVPRLVEEHATVGAAAALWELLARWFVRSMMAVLRRDLTRDYQGVEDTLQTLRGRVASIPTARAYYSGRIEIHCAYDDFVADTPLNRLLRAATREVSRSALLTEAVRRDALRVLARLEDVGEFRPNDMFASVDRRTWYCRDAAALAKHILHGVGRTFLRGAEGAWTFLIRTPEVVEAGIRQTLAETISTFAISKFSAPIDGASFGAHPDIVFGSGSAVGDIKYKLSDGTWNRPDLYELFAFAAAFRCLDAVLICFARGGLQPANVSVGETSVHRVAWNCSTTPELASLALCKSIALWTIDVERRLRVSTC
jgi:5-methylcytosine-specific restriction endonuclease McrBC regulatory subunit McrC